MTYDTIVAGADATTGNAGAIPAGLQAAGYSTGSGIAWTPQQWAAHPGAVRIDQDWRASDPTADTLDVEGGAASPSQCADWFARALADYKAAKRPGQRYPSFYASLSGMAAVANDLAGAGITGAGLWIAHYGVTQAEAEALITWGTSMGGPFPVIGFQYSDQGGGGAYDLDVFSGKWLGQVSGPPQAHTYGAPLNLAARAGIHSVALSWDKPAAVPGLPDPAEYRVFMYRGTAASRITEVPSYPRTVTGALHVQEGSLQPRTLYTAHVVASGAAGAGIRPWTYATAHFVTT